MKKTLLLISIIALLSLTSYQLFKSNNQQKKAEQELKHIAKLKSHFNTYVKTNKETEVFNYDKTTNNYTKIGSINDAVELTLVANDITAQTTYFELQDLNLFVHYKDISPIGKLSASNQRYKSFIIFNENIVTKDITNFYNEQNKLVFSLATSFDLPIIIKDTNRYGVEYNNQLLYVLKEDVNHIYNKDNTRKPVRTNIRTFTYHTVYDPRTQICNSIEICHTINQFTEHMTYLKDNNYLTLTMEELEAFLDNKIRIPLKTVAITLDDGIFLENSVKIIEELELYATFFIITSSSDASSYLNSTYARFESHTDNLHNNYRCKGGHQGSQMLCEKHDVMVADLKLSQEKLNGSYYFAYPFFDYNDNVIKALKEAGFRMAFVGQLSYEGYSDSKTNRYLLRRKTIFGNHNLNKFISYLN